jgi:hypothetical protein
MARQFTKEAMVRLLGGGYRWEGRRVGKEGAASGKFGGWPEN